MEESTAWVQRTVRDALVKEAFRVPHHVWHFVTFGVVIEALDKLHALPFVAVIVAISTVVPAIAAEKEEAVVLDRNAQVTIEHFADSRLVPEEPQRNPARHYQAEN